MKKRSIALVLALGCLTAIPVAAVEGQPEPETVTMSLWLDRMEISPGGYDSTDGWAASDGVYRYPLAYRGTVYVPLRSVAAWSGLTVGWDQEDQTVLLTTTEAPQAIERAEGKTPETMAHDREFGVEAQVSPQISVLLDGVEQSFTNVLGEPVYPVVSRECVYLPVRSVAELCGKKALWLALDRTDKDPVQHIYLYEQPTEAELAVARSFFDEAERIISEFEAKRDAIAVMEGLDADSYKAQAQELMDLGQQVAYLPMHAGDPLTGAIQAVRGNAWTPLDRNVKPSLVEGILLPEFAAKGWEFRREMLADTDMSDAKWSIQYGRQLLAAIENNM